MIVSVIVAIAENHVIGKDNDLVWRLPNDLKYFKSITNGHHILMGRKTFDSIGKPLPNRTNVVITRSPNIQLDGCEVVNSIQQAIMLANANGDDECFIIGGAEIYKQAMPFVDKIYLTEVKAKPEGNVYFELDKSEWEEVKRTDCFKDEKHLFDYSFVELVKH